VVRDIVKIERVSAPRNRQFAVDLCMDKRTGKFFARVGGEHIEADTKGEAVAAVEARLAKIVDVVWREVILLRVDTRKIGEDSSHESHENDMSVYHSSCSFSYARRERAKNPLGRGQVEREHREEFEERVAREREHVEKFEHDRKRRRDRADEVEQRMRENRAALVRLQSPFHDSRDERAGIREYELAYSAEAWAGVLRIDRALREMQAKLEEFVSQATSEKLTSLAAAELLRLLPAGGENGGGLKRRGQR
jgi:hypothetical protein